MRISDWSSDVCSSDLILVGGGLAKDIAVRHGISPKRSASLLDIFACVVQGVLPYGAQILLAGSLAAVSPLALAGKVYYCWILAALAVGFMLWPGRRASAAVQPDAACAFAGAASAASFSNIRARTHRFVGAHLGAMGITGKAIAPKCAPTVPQRASPEKKGAAAPSFSFAITGLSATATPKDAAGTRLTQRKRFSQRNTRIERV